MPRSPRKKINVLSPDERFNSVLVAKMINKVMLNGKKGIATGIVYGALEQAAKTADVKDPMEVLDKAISNVAPAIQLKSRRVGGSNYQIPSEVSPAKRTALALKWIIDASRGHKGMPMSRRLSKELIDAFNSTGTAFKKKEDTHRMAEANRAFAHLGRF
jgi:small subunit ribosomal protein S7